jgi:hypothetical protein
MPPSASHGERIVSRIQVGIGARLAAISALQQLVGGAHRAANGPPRRQSLQAGRVDRQRFPGPGLSNLGITTRTRASRSAR